MIEINCNIIKCSFSDRINVIGGTSCISFDSGTHKSHFYSLLSDQHRQKKLCSNKKIHFVDSLTSFISLNVQLSDDDCLIVDELNFDPSGLNTLFLKVRESNAWLIAIGRMYIKQFEYSVDAIWQLNVYKNTFSLNRIFNNVELQKYIGSNIICEDSTAIAAIYAEILHENIISAGGRSNFFKYINGENAFIIADKPKFGQELLNLIYRIGFSKHDTKRLVLFLPSCFEEIICDTCKIKCSESNENRYFDLEDYYEALAVNEDLWNKEKVTESIFDLHEKYDFSTSEIMQDLLKFYQGKMVIDCSRCYSVNIQDNMKYTYQDYSKDGISIENSLNHNIDSVDKMNIF